MGAAEQLKPKRELMTLDRAEYVAGQRVSYPPIMRKVASQYRNHKAHILECGTLVLESEADALDVAKTWTEMLENPKLRQEMAAVNCMRFHGENPGSAYSANTGPRGYNDDGLLSAKDYARELKGETHRLRDNFIKNRDEILRSGVKEELEKMMLGGKKRRRTFSEHDGDWNHDRRWDAAPFEATHVARKDFPFVELCFPLGMNAMASSKGITAFLSRCLALAEVLEAAGYRVAITAEDWTYYNIRCGTKKLALEIDPQAPARAKEPMNAMEITRYILRDATSYGSADQYAKLASSEFFRRVTFALLCPQAHWIHALDGREADEGSSGFGGAMSSRHLPARPGQVILDAYSAERIFSMDAETRALAFGEFLAFTSKV